MAEKDVNIRVNVQDQQLKDLNSQVNTAGISFGKLAGAIGIATGAYELASKAIEKTVEFLKDGVKAAMEEESANRRLLLSLNNNNAAYERMIRFKDNLFKSTLFSKQDINSAVSMGIELGRTEEQTKKMIQTAMGLSRVTGQDLNSVMMQLNATFEGTLGRLGRYEGALKGLTKSQLEEGDAVDLLNKKFGKLATEGMDTTEGKVVKAKKNLEELGKTIGNIIIPILGNLSEAFSAALGDKDAQISRLEKQFKDLNDPANAFKKTLWDLYSVGGSASIRDQLLKMKSDKVFEKLTADAKELNEQFKEMKKTGSIATEDVTKKMGDLNKEVADLEKLIPTIRLMPKNSQEVLDFWNKYTNKLAELEELKIYNPKTAEEWKTAVKLGTKTLEEWHQHIVETIDNAQKALDKEHKREADEDAKIIKDAEEAAKKRAEAEKKMWEDILKEAKKARDEYDKIAQAGPDDLLEQGAKDALNIEKKKFSLLKETHQLSQDEIMAGEEKFYRDELKLAGLSEEQINQAIRDKLKEREADAAKYGKVEEVSSPEYKSPGSVQSIKEVGEQLGQFSKEDLKDFENEAIGAAENVAQNAIGSIFDSLMAQEQKALQKTIDNIDKATERSQANLDKLNQRRFISDNEYQKRKDKLDKEKTEKEAAARKESAKKEKKYAEENALINAFMGAGAALASGSQKDPAYGIIMAAIVLAAGLADVAIIASKPLEYKQGGIVPSFASGGLTSPLGDPQGIPAVLHPNEGVLNSNAMSQPGMAGVVNGLNAGQGLQTQTRLHPDDIKAIGSQMGSQKVYVVESDISTSQRRVQTLQSRSTF